MAKEGRYNNALQGLDLTKVWENLVAEVGSINIEEGNTLQEQIEIEGRKKLRKLIASTEKRHAEKSKLKRNLTHTKN